MTRPILAAAAMLLAGAPVGQVIATVAVGEKPYDVLDVPAAPPVPSSQR